ncbi:TolC family protein [Oribacterium sp. oral taxon 102]|uniref:TolC family protein n=1 Tax=Oribacterium sp. oral taxon 102 TaxID=671214 RepID=UPI0015BB4F5E|nr:TolC family protein [Oribacterium sp. oral taxon 102]NWO22296.1 TolC family protein [Oribacterium sp. oral taxon 102]
MKGKRAAAAAMSAMLILLMSRNAFAFGSNVDMSPHQSSYERERTSEEWAKLRDNRIDWDELRDLVHEYNPTVSELWIRFRDNEHDGLYHVGISSALEAVEQRYSEASSRAGTDIEQAMADLEYQTSSVRTALDSTAQSTDREAARAQIEQTEQTVTETIRKSIITIRSSEEQRKLFALKASHNQSLYEAAVRREAAGQGTALDTLMTKESWEQSALSLQEAETQLKKLRQLLAVNLGWKYDASPELCAVPLPTAEQLSGLHLDTDTKLALQNNLAIRISERKQAVSGTDGQVNQLGLRIENQKEAVRSDMISRYQAVKQAEGGLSQARLTAQNAAAALQKAERSFSLGAASARDLEQARFAAESAELSVRIAEYSLASEYYDYLAGRDGIATANAGNE